MLQVESAWFIRRPPQIIRINATLPAINEGETKDRHAGFFIRKWQVFSIVAFEARQSALKPVYLFSLQQDALSLLCNQLTAPHARGLVGRRDTESKFDLFRATFFGCCASAMTANATSATAISNDDAAAFFIAHLVLATVFITDSDAEKSVYLQQKENQIRRGGKG
jgi:hypothetical protein